MDPITLLTLLSGDKNNLYSQFGFDPNGNNEVGAIVRRNAQGQFPVLASLTGLQNELIPNIQQAVRQIAQQLGPSGTYALANDQRANLDRQGAMTGANNAARVAASGGSAQAQEGARLAAQNASTAAGNQYQNNLMSPASMFDRASGLANLQSGLTSNLLQQLLSQGGFIEQRHAANQNEQAQGGLGGLFGSLGQFGGMLSGLGGLGSLNLGGLMGHSQTGLGGFNTHGMQGLGAPTTTRMY